MKKELTFSVIIPTLNEEKYLPVLLESLTRQTDKDFEVIVSDGPSKDKTREIAKSYQTKLPKLIVATSGKASLPHQRNNGAARACGKWLVFVDADSVLLPYFIERVKNFINREKPELFTSWCSPDSNVNADSIITLLANMFYESSIIFKRQIAPGPLAVVTRSAFEKVGGYDENLTWGEDYDFAQRLGKHGIQLKIMRETAFVLSLRRFRKEGKLKAIQIYAKAGLLALLTKKPPKNVPGYIMGGHFYHQKRKTVKKSVLKIYERKLKQLMKELFE